jgi:hypothetical protein
MAQKARSIKLNLLLYDTPGSTRSEHTLQEIRTYLSVITGEFKCITEKYWLYSNFDYSKTVQNFSIDFKNPFKL